MSNISITTYRYDTTGCNLNFLQGTAAAEEFIEPHAKYILGLKKKWNMQFVTPSLISIQTLF